MSLFLAQRNSAPTGANETVNEMNNKANDPLGGATCSESSLSEPQRIRNPNSRFYGMTMDEALDIIESDVSRIAKTMGVDFEQTSPTQESQYDP